jgi:hypothetical protein
MDNKKAYHISEREGKQVNLSKASLGNFVYHALKCSAEIYQLWAFNPNYERSSVFPAIKANQKQLDYLGEQGYYFVEPAKLNVN